VARMDRATLYCFARCCGALDGAGMRIARGKAMRRLRIIWTSRLDGSLGTVWADEGLGTMSADVSYLLDLSPSKGGCYGR
jgi:hypothetical protein